MAYNYKLQTNLSQFWLVQCLQTLESYDQDLTQMLKDLFGRGVPVKVCGTCMAHCGIYKNHPYFEGLSNPRCKH